MFQTNSPAHDQKNRKQRKHSNDGNTADDGQLVTMKVPPVAPGRLNQTGGHGVRYGYPAGDLVAFLQRIQKLVFMDGFGSRLERKLRRSGLSKYEQQRECCADRLEH